MKINLVPVGDRIIVDRLDERAVSSGGIIIPDNAKDKPQEGIVIAVGPGKLSEEGNRLIPMQIMVGARILFGKYSGTEIKVDGRALLLMREEEVMAVIVSDSELKKISVATRKQMTTTQSARGQMTVVG